jgi:hydrogenase maturation factor
MDGRVQDAVKNYMKENYSVDYVDMITEPGPNKILCDANGCDMAVIEDIKKRIEISVHHHGSKVVAIAGHFGCAGNPVEKEEQIEHLKKAKETVEKFGFPVEVVLLWVDSDWQKAEKI